MKPDPAKKNFSLLWILGGVAVAAGAALLFSRSKHPLSDQEYEQKEKDFLERAPTFIARLQGALTTQTGERRQETERLLHYFEHKLAVIEEAFSIFPNDLKGRKALYAVEHSLYNLETGLSD